MVHWRANELLSLCVAHLNHLREFEETIFTRKWAGRPVSLYDATVDHGYPNPLFARAPAWFASKPTNEGLPIASGRQERVRRATRVARASRTTWSLTEPIRGGRALPRPVAPSAMRATSSACASCSICSDG